MCMRTTLTIDDDVLQAARELAQAKRITAGKVLSDLARKGIHARGTAPVPEERSGIPLLPSRGSVRTPDFIRNLMDEEGV